MKAGRSPMSTPEPPMPLRSRGPTMTGRASRRPSAPRQHPVRGLRAVRAPAPAPFSERTRRREMLVADDPTAVAHWARVSGMAQEQKQPHSPESEVEDTEVEQVEAPKHDELDADIDDILDQIDDVLEVNAEDFVKSFIQKGGE